MQIIIQEYLKSEVKKMQHQCKNDWQCGYQNALNDVLHIIDELTPIELPSDEEIEDYAKEFVLSHDFSALTNPNHLANRCFQLGAKWMKEQILGKEDKTFKKKSQWTEVDNMTRRLK
jgi:hypothetical protein